MAVTGQASCRDGLRLTQHFFAGDEMAIRFDEIRHFGPENFCSLVDGPSTRSKSTVKTDEYGRQVETTTYYQGARVLGYQQRDFSGYRYYIRKG